jgi:spore germination cell wall hydrolase CwlJ-like protein
MSAQRHRPKNGKRRSFGLIIFCLAMMPTPIGLQDLAALIASQPAVSDRWRQYVRVTPFGTVQAATFGFPQPLGTMIPITPGYTFASLDPRSLDITGSIGNPRNNPLTEQTPVIQFPTVDRRLKGDLLVRRERPVPVPPQPRQDKLKKAPQKTQDRAQLEQPKPQERLQEKPQAEVKVPQPAPQIAQPEPAKPLAPEPDVAAVADPAPQRQANMTPPAEPAPQLAMQSQPELPSGMDLEFNPNVLMQREQAELPSGMDLEFAPRSQPVEVAADWAPAPDVESVPQAPDAVAELPSGMDLEFSLYPETQQADGEILTDEEPVDSDVAVRSDVKPENPTERLARLFFGADTLGPNENKLQPWRDGEAPVLMPMHPSIDPDIKRAAIEPMQKNAALAPGTKSEGETVAAKGEVTGEGRRPMTPAERLGLTGTSRVKHERCLTNAIYFEARGENERGQMAVAQVVLNRAFSGYYPDNVCGVVYQNSHRHLACQFTFACDNVRDVVTEPEAWELAKRIARDSLDGKIWLPEIGKATHYHATYVSPWWVRTMRKHKTLGIHIFYRPTRWGDGSDAPAWGPSASAAPSAAAAKM